MEKEVLLGLVFNHKEMSNREHKFIPTFSINRATADDMINSRRSALAERPQTPTLTSSSSSSSKHRNSDSSASSAARRPRSGSASEMSREKSTTSHNQTPTMSTAASTVSSARSDRSREVFLLDRMGGEKALDAVVEEFYKRLLADEVLQVFFEGVVVKKVKRHQKAFLKLAFTKIPDTIDVPLYLLQKHERLFHQHGLNETHFDKVAKHLCETLTSMAVPKKIIDEVVAIVGPLRAVFQNGATMAAKPNDGLQLMSPTDFIVPMTESGVVQALMLTLQVAGVTMVRVVSATVGTSQTKSILVTAIQANALVEMAESYVVRPDFASLRVLPNTTTAVVFAYRVNNTSSEISLHPACPRGLLARFLETVRLRHQLLFRVGGSITFRFSAKDSDTNEEDFLSTILQRLKQLQIPVTHGECGATMTIIFQVQNHAVKFVDAISIARKVITSAAKAIGKKISFSGEKIQSGLSLQISYRQELQKAPAVRSASVTSFSSLDAESQNESRTYFAVDGQSFVEGILDELPSLLAIVKSSFGNREYTKAGWMFEGQDAPLGVCRLNGNPAFVDFKVADLDMNLYLSLAAILASGFIGFIEKRKLRPPLQGNMEGSMTLPASLDLALGQFDKSTFLKDLMGFELRNVFVDSRLEEIRRQQTMQNSFF